MPPERFPSLLEENNKERIAMHDSIKNGGMMTRHLIGPLILLSVLCLIRAQKDDVVRDDYYSQLVGDAQEGTVEVEYRGKRVRFGATINPANADSEPHLSWEASSDDKYTMVMTDLDAPRREWYHWLIYDVPGNDLTGGKTLIEYMPPSPPFGTGKHRYLFLIHKQEGPLQINESKIAADDSKGRSRRDSKEFASRNKLDEPIAVGMFLAENTKKTN
ncbi:OV-16 antigen [Thelohanellus kitauei]|uniref:OV-16 antigen n=1 Tax=Thelohanellus kitauei TaxID=669202 RepID=A0A0C2JDW8_THEKT|nr:OV-16 antigen [Thelohanellus kitauei]